LSNKIKLGCLILLSLLLVAAAPFIGLVHVSIHDLLRAEMNQTQSQIFWQIRFPRAVFAFLAGGGLAIAGLVFQALFSNFLASPFTLGVASGAAFGTALYFNLGISFSLLGIGGASYFGIVGALVTIIPIFLMTSRSRRVASNEILLAGVVLSLFFSSLILFFQYVSDFTGIMRITRWLMGGFEVVGFSAVFGLLPFVLFGLFLSWFYFFELNLFTLGDELAHSRGVNISKTRSILFLSLSLMVGGIVSFCGPISSVGIMAPHICRLSIGLDHRYLVPATFLGGGLLVLICDTFARTIIAPYEIPVGIITALLEGPFFLILLYGRHYENRQS